MAYALTPELVRIYPQFGVGAFDWAGLVSVVKPIADAYSSKMQAGAAEANAKAAIDQARADALRSANLRAMQDTESSAKFSSWLPYLAAGAGVLVLLTMLRK